MNLVEFLAILSPVVATLVAMTSWRRNAKNDDKATAREMAVMTSEIKHNTERIGNNAASLERNAALLKEQIESTAKRLEEKIEAERRRVDKLENERGA